MVHGEWGYENMHAQKKNMLMYFLPSNGTAFCKDERIRNEDMERKTQKPELPRKYK